jgi:hypothetical protein
MDIKFQEDYIVPCFLIAVISVQCYAKRLNSQMQFPKFPPRLYAKTQQPTTQPLFRSFTQSSSDRPLPLSSLYSICSVYNTTHNHSKEHIVVTSVQATSYVPSMQAPFDKSNLLPPLPSPNQSNSSHCQRYKMSLCDHSQRNSGLRRERHQVCRDGRR